MKPGEIGTITARGGVVLRASPAREPCFDVVEDQAQMAEFPEGSLDHLRELLHGDFNEEVQSIEIAAQSLVDFPDAPWEIRLQLARQCWDEARHARAYLRRLLECGGHKGQFPVINQEWGVVCMFDTLVGRLAVQNRVFEAGSLDVIKQGVSSWGDRGDHATAELMDAVLSDEVLHVRFANEWFQRLRKEDPPALLKAISAMDTLRVWAAALSPPEQKLQHEIRVNVEDRRHAGFTLD